MLLLLSACLLQAREGDGGGGDGKAGKRGNSSRQKQCYYSFDSWLTSLGKLQVRPIGGRHLSHTHTKAHTLTHSHAMRHIQHTHTLFPAANASAATRGLSTDLGCGKPPRPLPPPLPLPMPHANHPPSPLGTHVTVEMPLPPDGC